MAARKGYTQRAAAADDAASWDEPSSTRRRIAAVAAAAGGWVTTWLCVDAVGLHGVAGVAVATVIEWLLFEFKREVLR